jgi:chorismate mutase
LYAKFASLGLTVRSESLQGFFAVLAKSQYQRAIAQLEAANATIDPALATQLFKNLIIQGYYANSSLSYLIKMGADINDPLDDGSSMVVLVADKGQPDDLSNFLKMGPRLPDFASLAIQAAKASNFKKVDYWVGMANKLGKPLSNTQANAVAAATVDVLDASQYQNIIAKLEAASLNVEPPLATRIFRRLLAQGRYSDSLIPYLIKAGADINVMLDDGSSMLLLIAEKGTTSELTNFLKMKPRLPDFNVEALQAARERNFTKVEYWVDMASKLGMPLSKAQSLAISATVTKERQLIAEEERRASAKMVAQPRYESVRNSLESVTFLYFDINKYGLSGPINVHAVRCTNGQSSVITEHLDSRRYPGLNAFFIGGEGFLSLNEAANRYCN